MWCLFFLPLHVGSWVFSHTFAPCLCSMFGALVRDMCIINACTSIWTACIWTAWIWTAIYGLPYMVCPYKDWPYMDCQYRDCMHQGWESYLDMVLISLQSGI